MLYTPLTKKALKLAYDAHAGQVDKAGMPYIFHPYEVALQVQTEEEVCAALLHDVVEDTDWTMEDLRAAGFPETVLEAV
ncbi:MAG: HD domain-containing protein, partial [Ruminococcus sp.]|nr:HD domain-containing protein [Ruminococcus sp.]